MLGVLEPSLRTRSHLRPRPEASAFLAPRVTFIAVKGIGSQAQGGGADAAPETLAVEKVALGAQPLHHVHTLLTEVAGVPAAQAQGERRLSQGFLRAGEKRKVLGLDKFSKDRPRLVEILNQITGISGLLAAAYATGAVRLSPHSLQSCRASSQADLNE